MKASDIGLGHSKHTVNAGHRYDILSLYRRNLEVHSNALPYMGQNVITKPRVKMSFSP